jgi:hypothetical protein
MGRLARYLISGFGLNLVAAAFGLFSVRFLFQPKMASAVLAILFPAFWLMSVLDEPISPASSGGLFFATLVVASSLLNIAFYAAVLFLAERAWRYMRRPESAQPSKSAATLKTFYLKVSAIGSLVADFSPFYRGPVRWLVITIWSLCVPSFLALMLVLFLYGLAMIAHLLSTNAGTAGRFLYYLSAVVWFLGIPCTVLALVGALGLLYHKLPARMSWSAFGFAAASGIAIGLTYLLFAAM